MDLTTLLIVGYLFTLLAIGYVLPFMDRVLVARGIAWSVAILTAIFSFTITRDMPPMLRMFIIISLQLVSMKLTVAVETREATKKLSPLQWASFCLAWFGMKPGIFETMGHCSLPFTSILYKGVSRIISGVVLLYFSIISEQITSLRNLYVPDLLMLAGFSLILHFGVLNLASLLWRMCGINAPELFRDPLRSASLKEFWGKRWNVAFSEMTSLAVYRPLRGRLGTGAAMLIAFLFSGLLHELAISVPSKAGFGLPMLYFVVHGVAMRVESFGFMKIILKRRWFAHVWVKSLLILPLPFLFHQPFMEQVLVPLRPTLLSQLNIIK